MASPKAYTPKPARAGLDLRATARGATSGFTLIEILVVMGLLAIMAGLGLLMSMETFRGNSFRNERDTLVSALQMARSQAMDNMCFGGGCTDGKSHGVYIQTDGGNVQNYIIFQGDTYNSSDPINQTIPAASYNIHLGAPVINQIVFDHLSGNVITAGDIILAGQDGHTSTISVNSIGAISWTN